MSYELIGIVTSNNCPSDRREQIIRQASLIIGPTVSIKTWSQGMATISLIELNPIGGAFPFEGTVVGDVLTVGLSLNRKTHEKLFYQPTANLATFGGDSAIILASHDLASETLTLQNDGVGLINTYYAIDSKVGFIFSTSLQLLISLGYKLVWDKQGIIEYLSCLHPLGIRTLIDGVSILPAGARLVWQSASRHMTMSATPLLQPHLEQPDGKTKAALIDEFRTVWKSNMQRLADRSCGRLVMGLSGGFDSRAIANGLTDIGVRPISFTYGDYRQREVRTACGVADSLGIPHLTLPVHNSNRLVEIDRGLKMLDGAMSPFELYENWFGRELRSIGDTFVTGTSGDVFWGSDKASGISDYVELRQAILHRYLGELIYAAQFIVDDWRACANDILWNGINETCLELSDVSRRDLSTFWNLKNRQRRWALNFVSCIRRLGLQYENPYYDAEFIKYAMLVPPSLRLGGKLYISIHKNVFWKTAHIPRSGDGVAPERYSDYLYYNQAESLYKQLINVARVNPLAAVYWAQEKSIKRLGVYARKLGFNSTASRIDYERSVFRAQQWIIESGAFRKRFAEAVSEAAMSAPDFVDAKRLLSIVPDIEKGRFSGDVLVLGRVISLCLWNKLWSELGNRFVQQAAENSY